MSLDPTTPTNSFTSNSVPASSTITQSFSLGSGVNRINVYKIKITPSAGGGTYVCQFYGTAAASGKKYFNTRAQSQNPYVAPVDIDSDGNLTEEAFGFILPYQDEGEGGQLHVKLTNNAAAARTFQIDLWYESPAIGIYTITGTKDGANKSFTLPLTPVSTGIIFLGATALHEGDVDWGFTRTGDAVTLGTNVPAPNSDDYLVALYGG